MCAFGCLYTCVCHLPSPFGDHFNRLYGLFKMKVLSREHFWVIWSPTETPLRFKYSNAVAQTAIFVGGKLWSSPSFSWLHFPFLWAELWRQVSSCFKCLLKLQRTDGDSTMKSWGTSVVSHDRTKTCWKRWATAGGGSFSLEDQGKLYGCICSCERCVLVCVL